jgi:hypothetical protein
MTTPGTHRQITVLLDRAKLSSFDRNNLYALTGRLAELDSNMSQNDYIIMYLTGKRDWRADYASVYNVSPTTDKKAD